ncbi:putative Co/Zn/Cd cation transporter (cation efflux family) [Pseudomonas duriflava]|uniref:Putative Co/Zn/Cd cation transporter (Cation efflux family) n=1 Tax=Pseudomonas duriflava TaxID=459528 RepID=A0A562PU83_9PSED|nr:cation transporter [Pseudomonas duriflava]TWI48001.1 putative Co/Zn/Cd cation transporter (cation efflux family) [Pseudomonas duriflava]
MKHAVSEHLDTYTEQGALRLSIVATLLVALFGITFGLLSGSFAIAFEGFYSLLDAGMTIIALMVTNLIAASSTIGPQRSRLNQKFTMGFWHLEPMVLGLSATLLSSAAVYALIGAVQSLLNGGRELEFDEAIFYSVVNLAICIGMASFGFNVNKRLGSDFIALDAKGWLMSAFITAALLVAFSIGWAVQGTSLAWISPYVDPAVLAIICLVIIPIPLNTIRHALIDVLLITPTELQERVDLIAKRIVKKYGFLSYRSYTAKVGRGRQIELFFIVSKNLAPKRLEEWDLIRDEIGAAIGGESPDRWLTIIFTTDPEWTE